MSNMQGNVGSIGHSQLGSLFPMPWRLLVAVLASVKGEPCDGAVKSFEPISNDRRASDFEGSTTRKGCSGIYHFDPFCRCAMRFEGYSDHSDPMPLPNSQ